MTKNQLTNTKSTALILGKSKSLMKITKRLLESKSKGLTKAKASQELTPHKDITIIGDLMWAKEANEKMNWDDAMSYAKNLRLGGYDDWHLPTREELEEVVRLCGGEFITRDDNDLDVKSRRNMENYVNVSKKKYKEKGFVSGGPYWSSTTYVNNSNAAWGILFSSCLHGNVHKIKSLYVRCVRVGQ